MLHNFTTKYKNQIAVKCQETLVRGRGSLARLNSILKNSHNADTYEKYDTSRMRIMGGNLKGLLAKRHDQHAVTMRLEEEKKDPGKMDSKNTT